MPAAIRSINSFKDLLIWLRDELDWPVEEYSFDELTFEYDADELGLKEEEAVKLKDGSIRQLRPLSDRQPFGIFFIEFEKKRLPVVVLRRILSHLVVKNRASVNDSNARRWRVNDIVFISAFGETKDREIAFAHFYRTPNTTEVPILRVLGWDGSDTPLKLEHVESVLKQSLRWPRDTNNEAAWREHWRDAFHHRPGHVIATAKELAGSLAGFAKKIRGAAIAIMAHESETRGRLQKLYRAFQSSLISDLTEEGFADTYAQTVTYGLLTAAISRTDRSGGRHGTVLLHESMIDMVPVTNPFLQAMLEEFLRAGGRADGVDFDELGINEVVEHLRGDETDIPAVLRDFGKRKPGEDPAIHFYEDFLAAYDKKNKIARGVFYTPKSVVSRIVRNVHEFLQKDFGVPDGLASTVTWGEMIKRDPRFKLPLLTDLHDEKKTISPDEPFVQILDPATGTATFLAEVIDVIYEHLSRKWKGEGQDETQRKRAWNEYVPRHLLPRLHGYELMMAPYAIAHMKIGLKLVETGYNFGHTERVRIYLTNALEPWQKQLNLPDIKMLAYEASAVNEIKQYKSFTVVIGNPPYSIISSNLSVEQRDLVEIYKFVDGKKIKERGALQFEKNINDDYVKFIRLGEQYVDRNGEGVLAYINNHSFLDNPTLRGMRLHLLQSFDKIFIIDLHGSSKKKETASDGSPDKNVFDIMQGVSINLFVKYGKKKQDKLGKVFHCDLYGTRESKYQFLWGNDLAQVNFAELQLRAPWYFFVPKDYAVQTEYEKGLPVNHLFIQQGAGAITAHDKFVIDFDKNALREKFNLFRSANGVTDELHQKFDVKKKKGWNILDGWRNLQNCKNVDEFLHPVTIRPFDVRYIFYEAKLVWGRSFPTMKHFLRGENVGLIFKRGGVEELSAPAFLTKHISESRSWSRPGMQGVEYNAPLYFYPDTKQQTLDNKQVREPNLDANIVKTIANDLDLRFTSEADSDPNTFAPIDLLDYIYAALHSPAYRQHYNEFLKTDFPRVPYPTDKNQFRKLVTLGGELRTLHLLESPTLNTLITGYPQTGDDMVTKPEYKITNANNRLGKVHINKTQYFSNVPETAWNFYIGGYQPAQKWLKDRKDRKLSHQDITHYQKIIVVLTETDRLMREIDTVQ